MTIIIRELAATKPPFLGSGSWNLKALSDITVIFGRNGSGKSQLLRTLRNNNKGSFHYASPERAGEISLDPGIMQQEMNSNSRADRRQSNLSPTYRQESVSRIGALLTRLGYSAGSEENHPIKFTDIEMFLSMLLPDFRFKIVKDVPHFEMSRIDNAEARITSVNLLSSGESEILSLALDLLTVCALWEIDRIEQRVLLIDEPDMHLHPDLQQQVAHFLVEIAEKYHAQILVATHSTTLLSSLGFYGGSKTSVIYLNNSANEQKAIPFDDVLKELSTCLGGHALMGPLFGLPLLLVEGDDDYQIWSAVPRYNIVRIAIIPCYGNAEVVRYQKVLERIFSSLREYSTSPVGYALLDGDTQLPQVAQANIKFIKLHCWESENLYLTDEVLKALDTNWEDAKKSIISKSKKYGQKQPLLEQCASWNRESVDLKNIINELSSILDPKKLLWTRRVGACIGINKPEGQLASFLGNDVMKTFWE